MSVVREAPGLVLSSLSDCGCVGPVLACSSSCRPPSLRLDEPVV